MPESRVNYSYATGKLLDKPNTYFYTNFQGQEFLNSWKQNRLAAIADGIEAINPSQDIGKTVTVSVEINTRLLLLGLINNEQDDSDYWIDRLIKKFEVTKRLYSSYQQLPPHRPSEDAGFYELDLYLLFAELLIKIEKDKSKLQSVNALLKVMDTLVSQQKSMTQSQRGNLNWLLIIEQNIIQQDVMNR